MKVLVIIFIIIIIAFFGLILGACSSNGQLPESKTNQDVSLITGSQNNEVIWHIKSVKETNQFFDKSAMPAQGNAISIEGECITKSQNTPFFLGKENKTKPIFQLEDKHGNKFEMGLITAKGITASSDEETDEFTIQFSLGLNSAESSIHSWGDLIIADPEDNSSSLPGHKVSLAAFDIGADN